MHLFRGVNTSKVPLVLGSLAMCFGLVACGSQQTPPPREASSPAPVEAFVAPPPGPIVTTDTPVTPQLRTSMATPATTPKRNVDPVVEASGPLSEPQRVVLGAVAVCMQRAVDKGNRLRDRSLIVNVTVETTGAVSSVDIDGANDRLKSCAEPEIRKVRYPSTDDSAGVRVMQYPMDVAIQDAADTE
jgi:hypothetical protein